MITLTILVTTFLAGAGAGVLVLVRCAIRREERERSFLRAPETIWTAAVRRLLGYYVRKPERTRESDDRASRSARLIQFASSYGY